MKTSIRNILFLVGLFFAGIFLTIGIMLINGDKKTEPNKQLNQTMNEMTIASQEYSAFMAQAQEKEADNLQIEINSNEIISKENKNVMAIDRFADLIGIDIDIDNNFTYNEFQVCSNNFVVTFDGDEQEYILFDELLQALGYTYSLGQDKAIISRACSSKRLIVEGVIDNISSATKLNLFDNTILQFDTEKDAIDNYIELSKTKSVFIDEIIQLEPQPDMENEDEEAETQAENLSAQGISSYGTYTGTHFNSWGGDTMGFYEYNNYLKEVCNNELRDVTVVVCDTGINYDHEMFKGRLSPYSMSFVAGETSAQYKDYFGHGTHVAGTICELTNSNVKILSLKVLDNTGTGYFSGEVLAYIYILKLVEQGLNICAVNASFGGYGSKVFRALETVKISEIRGKGVLFCAAAGNESQNGDKHYPSSYDGCIAISSIDRYGRLSDFSNYGSTIKFTAPGEWILSASCTSPDGLCIKSGTSMATPHITAAIAAIASDSRKNYTGNQIEDLLKNVCAVDLGLRNRDDSFGYGYINLRNLIDDYEDSYSETPRDYKVYIGIDRETYDVLKGSKIVCDYTQFSKISKTLTIYDYNTFRVNNLNTISGLQFNIYVNSDYEFIGWYVGLNASSQVGVDNYNQSTIYSTDKSLSIKDNDWDSDELYVIAKIKKKVINVKLVFTFEDVDYVDGMAGDGVSFYINRDELNSVNSSNRANISYRYPESGFYYTRYNKLEFVFEDVPLMTWFSIKLFLIQNEAVLKNNAINYDGVESEMYPDPSNNQAYTRSVYVESTTAKDFIITLNILV